MFNNENLSRLRVCFGWKCYLAFWSVLCGFSFVSAACVRFSCAVHVRFFDARLPLGYDAITIFGVVAIQHVHTQYVVTTCEIIAKWATDEWRFFINIRTTGELMTSQRSFVEVLLETWRWTDKFVLLFIILTVVFKRIWKHNQIKWPF